MRRSTGKGSRDSPKDNSSGLKPLKEPSALANSTRCDVEKESESGDPMGWARMGGLTDPNTRERMGGTGVSGEKGEGTQQGRNGAAPGFFAFPGGRGGLQI